MMRRALIRAAALVPLVAAAVPPGAAGQEVVAGSRVRVATSSEVMRGEVSALIPDSMLVRPDGYHASRAVCFCDVLGLDVSRGRSTLWLPLGLVGAVAGAALARPLADSGLIQESWLLTGIVGMAAMVLLPIYPFIDEDAAGYLVGAVIGGAVGVQIGLRAQPDAWQPVHGWERAPPDLRRGGRAR